MNSLLDKRWINYGKIPKNILCGVSIRLNENELIMVSESNNYENIERYGIYKYNKHFNKWIKILCYPKNFFIVELLEICIDKKLNKIYISIENDTFDHENETIFVVDIIKQTIMNIPNIKGLGIDSDGFENYLQQYRLSNQSVFENGNIHSFVNTFEYYDNNNNNNNESFKHFIWNTNNNNNINNECKILYDFKNEINGIKDIVCSKCIYVKSKNILLLIGGKDRLNKIKKGVGIWKFSLKFKKWYKICDGIKFKFHSVSVTLTANENYVIIAGGYYLANNKKNHIKYKILNNDKIYVLDIKNNNNNKYKLFKSTIKCPLSGNNNICRLGGEINNELLVIGWIRNLFKIKQFNNLIIPPMHIMKMIKNWYDQEMIHWLWKGQYIDQKYQHYAINCKYILSSLLLIS